MTLAIDSQLNNAIRESDAYRGRNTSMGALIEEADRIFEALASGITREEVKQRCFSGDILRQRTEKSRRRIWASIQHRYFVHKVSWVIEDLISAKRFDRKEFLDLLYLHYCLRDKLAFDVVTKLIWGSGLSYDHEMELTGLLPAHAKEWFDKPKNTWKELTPGNADRDRRSSGSLCPGCSACSRRRLLANHYHDRPWLLSLAA